MSKGTAGCNELQRPTPDEIAEWERRPLHPYDDLSIIDAFPEAQVGVRELQAEYLRRPITRCAEGLGLLDDFVARTGGAAFGPGYTTQGVYDKPEVYYRRKMCTTRKWYGECGTDGWPLCVVCLARMVFDRECAELFDAEVGHRMRMTELVTTSRQAVTLLASLATDRK